MKKSVGVTIGCVLSALMLTGCGEDRRCVDAGERIVSDTLCEDDDRNESSGGSGVRSYHWYHGGRGSGMGTRVSGGSIHAVSRGGFGHLASFHGSGSGS